MKPTIVSRKASNWVDRGEPPIPKLARLLANFFDQHDEWDKPWFIDHANIILGMVAADATEVHVAGYLKTLMTETSAPARDTLTTRLAAIALWHIAKAALIRDFAEQVLQGEVPANAATNEPLSTWLAKRLLTPEELARFQREGADAE